MECHDTVSDVYVVLSVSSPLPRSYRMMYLLEVGNRPSVMKSTCAQRFILADRDSDL